MAEEDEGFLQKYMWWLGGILVAAIAAYVFLFNKGGGSSGGPEANFPTRKTDMMISMVLLAVFASFSVYKMWNRCEEGKTTDALTWTAYISTIVLLLFVIFQSVTRKPAAEVYENFVQNKRKQVMNLRSRANGLDAQFGTK